MVRKGQTSDSEEFLSGGGEMTALIKSKDWTKTSLGSIDSWPQSLRTIVSVCLNLKSPALLFWGEELTIIHNDAFRKITPKNNLILGTSGKVEWSSALKMLEMVLNEGRSTLFENILHLLERDGYLQEAYFTYTHSPVYGESGKIGGIFTLVNETSHTIINERRQDTLNELTKEITRCKTKDEIYKHAIKVLGKNDRDFTGGLLYEIDKEAQKATFSYCLGFDPVNNSVLQEIDINGDSPRAHDFARCIQTCSPVFATGLKERIGKLPQGAWEMAPEEGALLPITHISAKYPLAILAITLNRHLKLDKSYISFLNSITEQIQVAITNLITIEQEKKISETHLRAEAKLKSLFSKAPLAICILHGPNQIIELANEKMGELLRQEPGKILAKPLFEVVTDVAGQVFKQMLDKVYHTGTSFIAKEFEVNYVQEDVKMSIYLKFVFEPLFDETGAVDGVMIVADDITEHVLNRKKLEDNEGQLKIAIEAAELGTYTWESPQPGLVFSDRMAQIYGYMGATNLTQSDLQKSSHPDDVKILEDAYEMSKKTGVLKYESRLIWPDQSLHWISVRSKIIFNDQTVPIKLYGTAMDITPQKIVAESLERLVANRTVILEKKNEELKRSEERYQKITEEVEDYAIILLSKNGTILNWNKGAEKINGYKENEITGKNFRVFYLEEDRKSKLPEKLIKEATANGRAIEEGYRIKKDGSMYWVNSVITALHDDKNAIIGFSKITRDLTERKRAEDKLAQNAASLEFQNKELQQFAYITSHDLQEPLRVIRMYSQLLDKKLPPDADAEMYSQKIQGAALRMQNLIKSVLNYSRLSSMAEEFVLTDLNEILKSVKSDFELMINEKNARIISEPLPEIKGVPLQLHQLFSNLISNSMKFSDMHPVINISAKIMSVNEFEYSHDLNPSLKYVEIKFVDNGIGFDEDYAEIIFEVFQRLHDRQAFDGTGVGLALCKKIVVNHHGFIRASSEPGKGSTFFVYLPVGNLN